MSEQNTTETTTDGTTAPRAVEAAPGAEAPARRPGRWRTVVTAVIGILAVLVLTVTIVAVWARATILRPEPVAELVGDALGEPEVQTALATYVTERVTIAVDIESVVVNVLPDALDRFGPAIAGGATAALERGVGALLAQPEVQDAVTTLVERAHGRVMRVLEGDGLADGLTVSDGEVSINLLPLVGRGLGRLQTIGLLDDVELPELTVDGDPDEQIAELSSALGRPLPDDFAQLVVYSGESVAHAEETVRNAQRMLTVAKRAVWLLVILSVVLIAATILVAPRRWRAALVLGLGTAATMVVLRVAIRAVRDQAPDLVPKPGAKAAVASILEGASATLLRVAGIVLILALVTVVATLLRTRFQRADLVLVAAVVLGTATVAVLGVRIWMLLVGVVVGVAVTFAARWLFPPPTTSSPPAAPAPA